MAIKWLTTQHLDMVMEGDNALAGEGETVRVSGRAKVIRLHNGMGSGASAVSIFVALDDGTKVVLEMSARMLLLAGQAIRARDEAEGRPL